MNICLISTGFFPEDGGGIGTYIYNLANGLKSEGHRIFVITQTWGDVDREEEIDGIYVYRAKSRYTPKLEFLFPHLAWSYFVSQKVCKLDREYGLDIIEFPNWEAAGFGYLLKKKRKPVVTRIHTPYFETLRIDKADQKITIADRFICWMEKKACFMSDALVSSTENHRQFVATEYGLKPGDIHILPLGIQVDKNYISVSKPITNDKLKVLYVSRLEYRKGTLTLIEAIPDIIRHFPSVEFYFVGNDRPHAPGGMLHKDFFLSKQYEYQDRIHFFGHVSDEKLNQFYREADIFVVPSVYESFGLIYIEAMLRGKPVVGCHSGGIPEVIKDEETGILVAPHNKEELGMAICRLLEDQSLREQMGHNARCWTEERFNHIRMSNDTEQLYTKVIKNFKRDTR